MINGSHDPYPLQIFQGGIPIMLLYNTMTRKKEINGTLPMDEMMTHEYPFEKLNEAMDLMKSGDPSYKKGVILF